MFHKNLHCNILLLASLCAFPTLALESDSKKEITIQSDRAELDNKEGTAIYIGDVILEQGTLKITADRITLYRDQQKKFTKAIAVGEPAHFQQLMENNKGLTKARGNTITYRTLDKHVTLLDDAFLEQEGNVFTGQTIIYDMLQENVSAKGGTQTEVNPESAQPSGRVKMVIQPESSEAEETDKVVPNEDT